MVKVHSKALDKTIEVSRVIDHISGVQPGPCLIFTGGIHGNEPSGVFALYKVAREIRENNLPLKGDFYALSGNLWALERGERFHRQDLNRLWTKEHIKALALNGSSPENEDIAQLAALNDILQKILHKKDGPFYFMDLHTTSSDTVPFLTVNDSLLNRWFTEQYPVPKILGIEEYLDGPLLSYLNELGYVAFGFEGGQHDDMASIENHVAFIYLSLVFSGILSKEVIDFDHYYRQLAKLSMDKCDIYEIFYRYGIKQGENFTMQPSYMNFQLVRKGEKLAESNGQPVKAPYTSRIFMPLYQPKGNDGFFTIRRIKPFFLRLSAVLRKWRFDRILPLLPGVRWASGQKETLIVDRRVARLFTKQFLHLLGYRNKRLDENHLIVKNREAASRYDEYRNEVWHKNLR